MLGRLPITLAQLNAGNNSEKFKTKIFSLAIIIFKKSKKSNQKNRSKKLTKQLYKSLTDII